MMKKLFAISMGFVNQEPKDPFITNKNSIYVGLMKELAYQFLNAGAKIYLPYPVQLIETEEELYTILASNGYCLMSFEKDLSVAQVIRQGKSIVRSYGHNLLAQRDQNDLDTYVECLSPYLISFTVEEDMPQTIVFEKARGGLNEVIERGRELPIHTRTFMAKFLEELHASETLYFN